MKRLKTSLKGMISSFYFIPKDERFIAIVSRYNSPIHARHYLLRPANSF
jgi:hypothetical protein